MKERPNTFKFLCIFGHEQIIYLNFTAHPIRVRSQLPQFTSLLSPMCVCVFMHVCVCDCIATAFLCESLPYWQGFPQSWVEPYDLQEKKWKKKSRSFWNHIGPFPLCVIYPSAAQMKTHTHQPFWHSLSVKCPVENWVAITTRHTNLLELSWQLSCGSKTMATKYMARKSSTF